MAVREIEMIRVRWPDDPYYDDVLMFDPESDRPQPEAEEKIRKMMGQVADGLTEERHIHIQSDRTNHSHRVRDISHAQNFLP